MSLDRLTISDVRNISKAELEFDPFLNLVLGDNGSGKSSLLEAIYLLGTGRSFRSSKFEPVIRRDSDSSLVFGVANIDGQSINMGVDRSRDGSRKFKINGVVERQSSKLAKELPLLYLGPETIELLTGSPTQRRNFLNWGVFHVEPSFSDLWLQANRCLKQRNQALRLGRVDVSVWTQELIEYSEVIDRLRREYFDDFEHSFKEHCSKLTGLSTVKCTYQRGWNDEQCLKEVFTLALDQDSRRGFTTKGFQRADIRVSIENKPVTDVCSRGELKILSWAMVLAQGRIFRDTESRSVAYLIDDIASEFDVLHRKNVCSVLEESGAQLFLTGIDKNQLLDSWKSNNGRVFHVKHGIFSREELDNE